MAGPPGLFLPTLELIDSNDSHRDMILLNEETNAPGKYRGNLSAPGGIYSGLLLSDLVPIGTFLEVILLGIDGEIVKLGDPVIPQHVQRLGQNVIRTNRTTGDTLPEILTEG